MWLRIIRTLIYLMIIVSAVQNENMYLLLAGGFLIIGSEIQLLTEQVIKNRRGEK